MKPRDLSEARDPDLRGSLAAMQRAAKLTREIAIQTNTAIVIMRDGKPARVTAEELRAAQKQD